MAPGFYGKKYEQPYSSQHVTNNTDDPLRSDEPAYIRNFSRFVYALYRKQTPFDITLLAHLRPHNANRFDSRSSSKKSVSKSPQRPQVNREAGFKTLGPKAMKSPTPLSSMPSDFEHIFHFSETQ